MRSRDGDLSASQDIQTNPLYSFSLGSRPAATMQLPQKLHLGVGDAGIIGRRVSVMAGSMQEVELTRVVLCYRIDWCLHCVWRLAQFSS
jgi:hypothetical protein